MTPVGYLVVFLLMVLAGLGGLMYTFLGGNIEAPAASTWTSQTFAWACMALIVLGTVGGMVAVILFLVKPTHLG